MPVNNFEDEVRKKMEELRFVPSGDVWTNVERKVREDRKRRRFLLWLPLTGLLAGGLIWFAWPAKKDNVQAQVRPLTTVTAAGTNTPETKTSEPLPSSPALPPAETKTLKDPAASASPGSHPARIVSEAGGGPATVPNISDAESGPRKNNWPKTPAITTEAQYLASQRAGVATGSRHHSSAGKKLKHESEKPGSGGKDARADHPAGMDEPAGTGKDPLIPQDGISDNDKAGSVAEDGGSATSPNSRGPVAASTGAPATQGMANAGTDPAPVAKRASATRVAKTDSIKAAAKAKNTGLKKNKIEWGFTVSGGISKQLEQNNIAPDVLNRAILNNTVYVVQHAAFNAGPAFSAGFVAAKQLGTTWRLQAGIQYAYASSTLPDANQRIYSAAPANNVSYLLDYGYAYAPGTGNGKNKTYSNRYQSIQVPITVEKQLTARSPLSIQTGLIAGYLSTVHALIYQPLLDQYLQDNSKYNRIQLAGLVGVYWKFKVNEHWSLRAGPELQYQFSDLMKNTVPLNDHLITGAVRLILLHRSK